jgi:hypothetical protein
MGSMFSIIITSSAAGASSSVKRPSKSASSAASISSSFGTLVSIFAALAFEMLRLPLVDARPFLAFGAETSWEVSSSVISVELSTAILPLVRVVRLFAGGGAISTGVGSISSSLFRFLPLVALGATLTVKSSSSGSRATTTSTGASFFALVALGFAGAFFAFAIFLLVVFVAVVRILSPSSAGDSRNEGASEVVVN